MSVQIGENLKSLRKSMGLTQQQVADKLNISRVNYTRYETNASNPDFQTLVALADFYDVSLDLIFGRKGYYLCCYRLPPVSGKNPNQRHISTKNMQLKNRSLKPKGAVLICRFDIYSCIFVLLTSFSDETVLSGESGVSFDMGILRNRVRKDSVL